MSRPIRITHVATVDLTLRALLLPQLSSLRDAGFDVSTISAPGPWVASVESEGIRHIPWKNATRSWDPIADARAFLELVKILRRERFDVVHTHNAKPGVMGRIGARITGTPCVVNTVHGFDARLDDPMWKRLSFMGLEWLAAKFSDLELYQAKTDLARARRLRMTAGNRGVFLGNGTSVSRFDPSRIDPERIAQLREEFGIGAGELVVGTLGRLVGEKGYRELCQAARRIREVDRSVHFLAIGEQDLSKSDVLTDAELHTAGRDVFFAGWRENVPELLAIMDIFVLPSWREGVPRSAIEAAAMGCPLILSNIPGCREVVRHGTEGLLVPPRDPDRLTEAISTLLSDASLRERMGAAARIRAIECFDERRIVATILEQYGDLLHRKGICSR
jgi:glycosyltransferase involved in cell wall biosynthesis